MKLVAARSNVGVRCSSCTFCKAPFQGSITKKEVAKQVIQSILPTPVVSSTVLPTNSLLHGVILTPAGKCPCKLNGANETDVLEWKSAIESHYEKMGRVLALEAIVYFIRHFYSIFSPEYDVIKTIILKG